MRIIKKSLSLFLITMIISLYQNCTPFEANVDGSSVPVSEMNYFVGLFDKVIAPNCLTCHSGTSPSGNTDLSTYSAIIASGKVVVGDSSTSALYTVVSNPTIPEHDGLNANQLIALSEWIEGGARENESPVASAGADRTVRLPTSTASLDGRASDIDGTIASYLWSQTSGPNTATLTNQTTSAVSVSGLISGSYVFTFRATDDKGAFSTDTVSVSVTVANNVLPTVELGANRNLTLPTSSITLTSTSSDSDGTITNYLWTQTVGPNTATLSGATTATLAASNLVQGTYAFRLAVTDDRSGQASDTVSVIVAAAAPVGPTYATLRSEIFVPLCLGCHSGSNPRGQYNMSTYTAVMSRVQAGNALQSVLHQRVADGSMPTGGGLPTADQNRIRDWINAGALNN